MKEIKNILKPLKNKIFIEKGVNIFVVFMSICIILSAILVLVSKFVYISDISIIVGCIFATCAMSSIIASFIMRPSFLETASKADKLGYKERFTTIFYLKEDNSKIYNLILNDAISNARGKNFKKEYKLKVKRKYVYSLLIAGVVLMISGFIPSPVAKELEERKVLHEEIDEKIKKLEKEKEELLKTASPKQAEAVEQIIKEMKKELKGAKSEAESIKASQKAQESLKKLSNNSSNEDLKELGQMLQKHDVTKELGEALEAGDEEAIKNKMDDINKFLENATDEEIAELAEIYNEVAESLSEDNELKKSVQDLNEALNSGEAGDYSKELSKHEELINKLASENKDFKKAIDKYSEALSDKKSSSTNKSSNSTSSGSESQKGNNSTSQQGEGQEGQSGQQGEGQEGGSGQQGEGQEGKSSQQGEGQNGANGNGSTKVPGGKGDGEGHINNEQIYSRPAESKSHEDINIDGTENDSGTMEEKKQERIGERGEMTPYNEVYGEYKEEALNVIEDYSIPYGMKEIVKDYFTSLE